MSKSGITCHLGCSDNNLNDKTRCCPSCEKCFTSVSALDSHKCSMKNLMKPFSCNICKKRFAKELIYNYHVLSHSESYNVKVSKKRSPKKKSVKLRLGSQQNENTSEKKSVKLRLGSQQNEYTSEKKSVKLRLGSQQNKDTSEKLYTCEECNMKFYFKNNFENHVNSAHITSAIDRQYIVDTSEKLYTCEACNKKFYLKNNLENHVKSAHMTSLIDRHISQKLYTCEECNKKFYFKKNLEQHVTSEHASLIHRKKIVDTSEKRYTCEKCNKKFYFETNLESHIKKEHITLVIDKQKTTVTSEKLYACEECNKKFYFEVNLENHVNTAHKSLNPEIQVNHLCYVCNRSFSEKQAYEDHVLSHTGARVYICSNCRKQFPSISKLYEHQCTFV